MIDMTSVSVRFVLARISDPQTAKCDFYWSSGMDERNYAVQIWKFANNGKGLYTLCPTVRHRKLCPVPHCQTQQTSHHALLSDTAKLANQLTNSHHWSLHFLYRTGCSEFHIIT